MESQIDQLTRKMEIGDLVAEMDNVSIKVLMNPLILNKIFSTLNTTYLTGLKSARLVCSVWAELGAKFLDEQGSISFSTDPDIASKELLSFNKNLAKNVALTICRDHSSTCICSLQEVQSYHYLPPNSMQCLPEIYSVMDTLQVTLQVLHPHLDQMWNTYDFPNLTHISIIANILVLKNEKDIVRPEEEVEIREFRPLPNLKLLRLKINPAWEQFSSNYAPIFQRQLNASPNLEELNMEANFYPDLTPCKYLKKLTYEYEMYHDPFSIVTPDMNEFTRMLNNCRDSLENLCVRFKNKNSDVVKLRFDLPNLTHLTIDVTDAYKIEDSLNISSLPKLAHLSLDYSLFCKFSVTGGMRHSGITSLHVRCTHHAKDARQEGQAVAAKFVNLFPTVAKLELDLMVEFDKIVEMDYVALKETVETFGGWDLSSGEVKVAHHCYIYAGMRSNGGFDSDGVIAILEGISGWRGLAKTSLKFVGGYTAAEFDFSDKMRHAMLSCRNIRKMILDQFQMEEETLDELDEFIEEHELSISFPHLLIVHPFFGSRLH